MGRGGPAQGPARPPTSGAFSAGRWTCPGHSPRWSSALTAASHRAGRLRSARCVNGGLQGEPRGGRPTGPPLLQPLPAAARLRGLAVGRAFRLRQANQHARAWSRARRRLKDGPGPGRGVPADSPTARATCGDGAGPADSGRGGPAPWGAPQVGSRAGAPALQRAPCRRRDRKASAAIWWRRGGSCGAAWGGPARARGRARRSVALRLSSRAARPRSPTHPRRGAAPDSLSGVEFGGGRAVRGSAPGLWCQARHTPAG